MRRKIGQDQPHKAGTACMYRRQQQAASLATHKPVTLNHSCTDNRKKNNLVIIIQEHKALCEGACTPYENGIRRPFNKSYSINAFEV